MTEPSPFLIYMPTYAPDTEAVADAPNARLFARLSQSAIRERINELGFLSRLRPWVYMDCIDSVLNTAPGAKLVVADAKSTDSIRTHLASHHLASLDSAATPAPGYELALFMQEESQWAVLNEIYRNEATPATRYFVYTSSDIVWTMDWLTPAARHFEADPSLQIIFPCVSSGDPALPCQVAPGPRDLPLIDPPWQDAARAPVLNAYAFICRMDFLDAYGGYPTVFRNCFTESFLHYMCEAIGGKMRLMPEGWLYHHNGIDAHGGGTPGGGYNYLAEKPVFDRIMDEVQLARAEGRMTKELLRGLLYV